MAKKITQLPPAGSATGADLFETVQGGVSKKMTLSQMAALLGSGFNGKWTYGDNANADPPWAAGTFGYTDDGRGDPGDENFVQPGSMITILSTSPLLIKYT